MKHRLGVLDGLRGIAILQVLSYHIWLVSHLPAPARWLQFIPATGYFGVHLFFFLSGFVIVYPFIRAQFTGQAEPTWRHFAWRRFIKIVPSYALSIAIAYAIGYAAYEHTHSTLLQDLVSHALFIHTWWPQTSSSINGALWTLAIEAQFYAIFPAIWWCFKRSPWATGLGLVALGWTVRAESARCCAAHAALLISNLPTYIDIFAWGMLCALMFVHFGRKIREGRARHFMPVIAAAGAAIIILTMIRAYEGLGALHFWGVPVTQPRTVFGIGALLLAFGALCSTGKWTFALSNPLLGFLAIVSYNLYLYNGMIVHELQVVHIPPYTSDPSWDPHWQVTFAATAFLVSIAFATIVTYVLERPLLRLPDPRRAANPIEHVVQEQTAT